MFRKMFDFWLPSKLSDQFSSIINIDFYLLQSVVKKV